MDCNGICIRYFSFLSSSVVGVLWKTKAIRIVCFFDATILFINQQLAFVLLFTGNFTLQSLRDVKQIRLGAQHLSAEVATLPLFCLFICFVAIFLASFPLLPPSLLPTAIVACLSLVFIFGVNAANFTKHIA